VTIIFFLSLKKVNTRRYNKPRFKSFRPITVGFLRAVSTGLRHISPVQVLLKVKDWWHKVAVVALEVLVLLAVFSSFFKMLNKLIDPLNNGHLVLGDLNCRCRMVISDKAWNCSAYCMPKR
jgi:hypothetical protein